jgi:two-component system CheB/CheR fusion protein
MTQKKDKSELTIVGIGASAGGLGAIENFFKDIKASEGIAYIFIQHLSPKYESMLPDILEKHTDIPIRVITDGEKAQGNTIYLKPTDKDIIIKNQKFSLVEPQFKKGSNLPIDRFFRSLAKDLKLKFATF